MRQNVYLLILLFFAVLMPVASHGQEVPTDESGGVPITAAEKPITHPEPMTFSNSLLLTTAVPNQAPTDLTDPGDWNNTEALACIIPLGAVLNASTVASLLVKPPPFDYPPSVVAYLSNLGLKFCAPYLNPPHDIQRNPSDCTADFAQYEMNGTYSNILGFPSPFSDLLPGTNWGELGTPTIVHWSTGVAVTSKHNGQISGDQISFDTGRHTIVWRGDTLLHPMDLVFIYIPGLGQERKTLRMALNAGKFGLDQTIRALVDAQPNPIGIYNEEVQMVVVTDLVRPRINSSMQQVTVEAVEPGGVSSDVYLHSLRRTISVSDNCDDSPDLRPLNAPDFAAVGQSYDIQWEVRDDGPRDSAGGYNSSILNQTLTVVDTKPPLILAPPSVVTETAVIPAPVDIGHPAVFDLADLEPAVSHNACTQPSVLCDADGTVHYPTGKTTVTWTATDQSGNSVSTTQLVNIKAPGTNNPPLANSQMGSNTANAISFEPITLTLKATDPDADPLWFSIDDQPDNGFFQAPLLPYFIQDYRLANVNNIDFDSYCTLEENRQEYVPTNWPIDARFMAVDDAGNTFVYDLGMIWCTSFGTWTQNYRLAIFRPDGSWEQISSNFDVKDVYIDQHNGFIYTASTNVGGTFTHVRQYDLDLKLIESYRLDVVDYYLSTNGTQRGFADQLDLVYASDGGLHSGTVRLYVYDGRPETIDGQGKLIRVADYSQIDNDVRYADIALDSERNLYASARNTDRIYKFSPITLDEGGNFIPGELIGWLGKCDYGPGCDIEHGRSFGFSCTEETCGLNTGSSNDGSGPGQFSGPYSIALDPNDILYVTDYNNLRVQRFTPDGYYAGQAISECDGSCFVLGDFGKPEQVTVNSNHFYVLDDEANLLHVFETTPLTHIDDDSATIVYRSDNNFVGTDSFAFRATDGLAESQPAQVSINVGRNFRPPQADRALQFSTAEDTQLPLPLSGYDPDEPLDSLTFQIDQPPANGTISGSEPNRFYTPNPDFVGVDTFTFVANDGNELSMPQTVTVTVTAVNDPPRFPEENQNFAFRTSGQAFSLTRFSTLNNLQVGRGFSTLFKVDFYDPDAADQHLITVDWGDDSPLEEEGEILEDGTVTGPLLSEGINGGNGTVTAEHVFSDSGTFTVSVCVTDNVIENGGGEKETTAASETTCTEIPLIVAPMTDILLDVEPSTSPVALGDTLAYTLTVTNNAPESGSGLTATDLEVTSTLDERVNFQTVETAVGSCGHANRVVTCQLDSLAAGETAVVVINTTLNSGAAVGDQLELSADYQLNQPNQAETQFAYQATTVVAPADFIVNTIADAPDADSGDNVCRTAVGDCTLRAAIEQANVQPGLQTIALDQKLYWFETQLQISGDVQLIGLGAMQTYLNGNGAERVLSIQNGADVMLTNLAIMGGRAGVQPGGGLYNIDGSVTLNNVLVSNNQADGGGAGIWNGGTMTINNSAVTGNLTAAHGGGLHNEGTLTLNNVTVSGNTAGSGGGLSSFAATTLNHVTVSGNTADAGGGLNGGPEAFTLKNTILAGNTAVAAGPDCGYGLTSLGHNLIGDTADCTIVDAASTDILNANARLLPLNQAAGQTPVLPLSGGSPAVDTAACILPTDQRGVSRPIDGDLNGTDQCDMGAFEFEPSAIYLPLIAN